MEFKAGELLNNIQFPQDLRALKESQLSQVSDELRRRRVAFCFLPLRKAQHALTVRHDHNFLQVEKAHADG